MNYWNRSAYREKVILQNVRNVIGRTVWDCKAMSVLSPNVNYYYGGEMLRADFYNQYERIIPKQITIVSIISAPLYKGYDLIIKIADILKRQIHLDFKWLVYGNVECSFTERIVGIKHEDVNICLYGVASANQLKESLLNCTLYVHPSYTENSPNSIAEAQILGVPVVATNVGGTSSMVEDGTTGLLFPATDPYMGACNILRVVNEPEFAMSMGNAGRKVALIRHDKNTIINQLIETYKRIIADDRKDN